MDIVDRHNVFDIEIQEQGQQKTQSGIFEILRPKQSLTENLKYISNYNDIEESLGENQQTFGNREQNLMELSGGN